MYQRCQSHFEYTLFCSLFFQVKTTATFSPVIIYVLEIKLTNENTFYSASLLHLLYVASTPIQKHCDDTSRMYWSEILCLEKSCLTFTEHVWWTKGYPWWTKSNQALFPIQYFFFLEVSHGCCEVILHTYLIKELLAPLWILSSQIVEIIPALDLTQFRVMQGAAKGLWKCAVENDNFMGKDFCLMNKDA